MFNLTVLLISLFAPAAIMVGFLFSDWFLKTELFSTVVALIYFEHLYLGFFLAIDIEKGLSDGFFPMPGNAALLTATAIFDYLLGALAVYVLLTALTKCFVRSKLV